MYLVGWPHPHPADAQLPLEALVAAKERYGIDTIFSFNADFDRWPELERISIR